MNLETCLSAIARDHFPSPPLAKDAFYAAISALPFPLPADLRAFYGFCNGARLFSLNDPHYRIVPLEMMRRTRLDIYGVDQDDYGSNTIYTICDVQDGNFIGIELSESGDHCRILDCFHEDFLEGERREIASSFTDFLRKALNSSNKLFWL